MADTNDVIDGAGLVAGATPWQLTPDCGIEAPHAFNVSGWTPPTFGGDISNTTMYPSQEPPSPASWPRDAQVIVNAFNANPIAHGADIRNIPAEGGSLIEPTSPWCSGS